MRGAVPRMSTYKELLARQGLTYESHQSAPLDLDYLIDSLRNPKSDATVKTVLGYIYHYVPFIKQEHNLRLVIAAFLRSPLCFGKDVPSFEDNYLIIEVFHLITNKKLQISQPTLPIKTFYTIIKQELERIAYNPANCWRVLPCIAGMSLSNKMRNQLYRDTNVLTYGWFFHDWDEGMSALFRRSFQHSMSWSTPKNVVNLSLLSFAIKYEKTSVSYYTGQLSFALLIRMLVDLMFDLDTPGSAALWSHFLGSEEHIKERVSQRPVVKHINRLSFLLEALISELPHDEQSFELLLEVANRIRLFNKSLSNFTAAQPHLNSDNEANQVFWFFSKGVLFAEVIIFQGMLTRFIMAKNRNVSPFSQLFRSKSHVARVEAEYVQVCRVILHCLYYNNFILKAIGLGGFDSYNFVYYVSLEVLLHNNQRSEFERFSEYLIGDYTELNLHPDALNRDYVRRCKVLFVMGIWENYFQQYHAKDPRFVEFIYRTVYDLVGSHMVEDTDLVEAGHLVLLLYFTNMENTSTNFERVLHYYEVLVNQFPSLLSATQLSMAVETLGKKLMSNHMVIESGVTSAEAFLRFGFAKCAQAKSDQPVRQAPVASFSSAQPISEINAPSTLSQLETAGNDVIDANDSKAPRDLHFFNPIHTGSEQAHFEERTLPETSREALIVSFVNVIPYVPLNVFRFWLEKMWVLINESSADEAKFLTRRFWRILSENLDSNRAEIAYEWWYEEKHAVEAKL